MRLVFVLLGIRFLFCDFIFKSDSEELITWREDRPLTWNDFKGVPQKKASVASTYYNIHTNVVEDEEQTRVDVKAVFFPDLSWKQKDRNDQSILIHEQKHFDITELFARRLRKRISELKFSNARDLNARLAKLYSENDKALEDCQNEYDRQTDHSRNGSQQKEWNKKIQKALFDLKEFRDSTVSVVFR